MRYFPLAIAISIPGIVCGVAAEAAEADRSGTLVLVPRPTHVYKTTDRSHENTESWIFSLMVQTGVQAGLAPAAMKLSLLRNSELLATTSYTAEGLKPLTYQIKSPPRLADGRIPPTPIFWPIAIRIRVTEPISLGVTAMRIELDVLDASRLRHCIAVVPIETYRQKTSLVFPFRGRGIILQGSATHGGHRNRSGQFALDASGLDESWSIVAPGEGKLNGDYRGWGRGLIAPADGVVVRLCDTRPDQPVGDASDSEYYAPEYKQGGDPGNFLVIDHGGSEYSMIAHFQADSILVKLGDRVRQGQALGKLGHSGDSNGPHCHYQLQAGPDWEHADALPCKFSNVEDALLDRGTYFETK